MTILGTKTAMIAGPTPPDFFPPTTPAMSEPVTGSQNRRNEFRNSPPLFRGYPIPAELC
jgi:hypothetical protein